MSKVYNTTQSRFFCTRCGREGIPVQRKRGQDRQGGHLKKLYCLSCQEETNHAEIREIGGYSIEDFQTEFKLGRFIDGNRVPVNELLICSCHKCPFNIDGRCWNANYTYDCKYRPKLEEESGLNE